MRDLRTDVSRGYIVGPGSIIAVGLLTFFVHVLHFVQEEAFHALTLGVLLPMALSGLLVAAGGWLYRSDFEGSYRMRVTGWTGFGIVGGVLFGYPVVPYQAGHGVQVIDVEFMLINWLVAGALGGFLVGFYDARQRHYRAALQAEHEALRTREQELQRENERLETFASILAHDLRNPLNVTMGRIDLARETTDSEHIQAITDALQRMDTIIEDVLTMAREGGTIDDADIEPVTVSDLVTACWDNVDTGTAQIETVDEFRLRADPSRLKHVFENLFRNAVDHSDEPVTIRVGELATADGFYVEDTGPGIPESERDQVFEPGYTTSSDGTGLGLYLVRTIVDAHGWDLTVTEGADGGARFEITGIESGPGAPADAATVEMPPGVNGR